MTDKIAQALIDTLVNNDGEATGYSNNLASAVFAVARALNRLGTNDAATQMGAIEFLATEVRAGLDGVADAISGLSDAVRSDHPLQGETFEGLQNAIAGVGEAIGGSIDSMRSELHGIGQEIGWGLDPDDNRKNHL